MSAPHHHNKRHSKASSTPEQAIVEGMLKGVWQVVQALFSALGGKKGSPKGFAKEQLVQLSQHWEQVEMYALQESTWAMAVSEGDKIVDAALRIRGIPGESMGERLKAASGHFPADMYQDLWNAHKLRNAIAHEVGVGVSQSEARQAVAAFRSALYYLKVLS